MTRNQTTFQPHHRTKFEKCGLSIFRRAELSLSERLGARKGKFEVALSEVVYFRRSDTVIGYGRCIVLEIKHKSSGKVLARLNKADSLAGRKINGVNLSGASFVGQDMRGVGFISCNLTDADFSGCNLGKSLVKNSVLRRANFSNTVFDEANFSDAIFEVADFSNAVGKNVKFRHSKLNGADCTKVDFSGSDFSFAEIRANFQRANLKNSNLYGADLSTGSFVYVDFEGANMTDAKILRADFTYAKMQGCIGTNGKPWGQTVKNPQKKKWWQGWSKAAL